MKKQENSIKSNSDFATRGPLSWRIRKQFWAAITYVKFKASKPAIVPWPKQYMRKVRSIPFSQHYPTIPTKKMTTMDHIPKDEVNPPAQWVQNLSVWINNHYSQMQADLPEIYCDDNDALAESFTSIYEKILAIPDSFNAPILPEEFEGGEAVDLGALAVSSHYDFALTKKGDGSLVWDFTELGNYEHHSGLVSLGVLVEFELASEGVKKLEAKKIVCEYGEITPDDDDWAKAVTLAICAATTYQSIVRHFVYGHAVMGCQVSTATRNSLKADHPLYRLMWPHIYRSHHGLELVCRSVAEEKGDFVTAFSFTFSGLVKLFDDSFEKMQSSFIDPYIDWTHRGLDGLDIDFPAQDNMCELYDAIHAHAERYIMHYYKEESDIANDSSVTEWVNSLNDLLPNGIERYLDEGKVTRGGIIKFVAAFIHFSSGIHEALGSSMWNYQMWPSKNPPRVYKDGRRIPTDVFQRMVNADIIMNVSRAPMLDDYAFCALDDMGQSFFHQFLAELATLQVKYDREQSYPWKMEPKILEININN